MHQKSTSRTTSKPIKPTFAFASILLTLIFSFPLKATAKANPSIS